MESCQHQCCLGDGEGTAHLIILGEFLKGIHRLHGSQVDASEHDMQVLARFHVSLYRLLPVQFYGEVHHIAAFHQAVRRCIRPSAGDIYTHRTAAPYYLVHIHITSGLLLSVGHRLYQSVTQQCEGLVALTAEHRIMDACHQRRVVSYWCRHCYPTFRELPACLIQVQLIEHAVPPVGSHLRIGSHAPFPSLGKESAQIGLCGYFLSTQVAQWFQLVDICQVVHYRELLLLLFRTHELVIYMIQSHTVLAVTYRHHVNTFAWIQRESPVILGHARDDMVVREIPLLTHATVFYPYILVGHGHGYIHLCILDKDRRMRFSVQMEDIPLVVHDILDRHHGRDHLP